jgi:ABC-2 type transport system permease protein
MNAAPAWTRRIAMARWELHLLSRNGEQVLLAFIIPAVLLVALRFFNPDSNAVAAIVVVSALATSFTSLAIGTGFERRAGALRFFATTPLSRIDILAGKVIAQAVLAGASAAFVIALALVLGSTIPWLALLCLLPIALATYGAWGFWLAGQFRAEAVLAIANGVFVILIAFGGVIVSANQLPVPMNMVVAGLPTALFADGLRGDTTLLVSIGGLLIWFIVGIFLAKRSFRWD